MSEVIRELVVKVGADIRGYQEGLGQVEAGMKRLQTVAGSSSGAMDRMAGATQRMSAEDRQFAQLLNEVAGAQARLNTLQETGSAIAGRTAQQFSQLTAADRGRLVTIREEIAAEEKRIATRQRAGAALTSLSRDAEKVGLVAGAGLAFSAKTAINFESAFAGVRKAVTGTEPELRGLERALRDLVTKGNVPLAFEDVAKIARSGAELGVAKESLVDFTKVIAQLSTTTNLSADQAADAFGRISTVLKLPASDFSRLGSVVAALGNAFPGTEKDLVEFMKRLSGFGAVIGMPAHEIGAFGQAMVAAGLNAEQGSSAMGRVFQKISAAASTGGKSLKEIADVAGLSTDAFKKAFAADSGRAIAAFIEGLGKLKAQGVNLFPVLDELGFKNVRIKDTVLRLAVAGDVLTRTLDVSKRAWEENTALTQMANARWDTTESKLKVLSNTFRDAAADLGTELLPAIKSIAETLREWLTTFNQLDPATKGWVVRIGEWTAGLGLLAGALGRVAGLLVTLKTAGGIFGAGGAATAGEAGAAGAAGAAATRFGPLGTIGGMLGARSLGTFLGGKLADLVGLGLPKDVAGVDLPLFGAARVRQAPAGGSGGMSIAAGANVRDLTEQAKARLQALNATLADLGFDGTVTSGKRNNPGISSNHNLGTAIDLVSKGNMQALAAALGVAGFDATFERKGQRNSNGSIATGDHIHIDLLEAARRAAAAASGGSGALATGASVAPHVQTEAEKERSRVMARLHETEAGALARLNELKAGGSSIAAKLAAQFPTLTAAERAHTVAILQQVDAEEKRQKAAAAAAELSRRAEQKLRGEILSTEAAVRNLRGGRTERSLDVHPGVSSPLMLRLAGAAAEKDRLEGIARGEGRLRERINALQGDLGSGARPEDEFQTRIGVSSPLALRLADLQRQKRDRGIGEAARSGAERTRELFTGAMADLSMRSGIAGASLIDDKEEAAFDRFLKGNDQLRGLLSSNVALMGVYRAAFHETFRTEEGAALIERQRDALKSFHEDLDRSNAALKDRISGSAESDQSRWLAFLRDNKELAQLGTTNILALAQAAATFHANLELARRAEAADQFRGTMDDLARQRLQVTAGSGFDAFRAGQLRRDPNTGQLGTLLSTEQLRAIFRAQQQVALLSQLGDGLRGIFQRAFVDISHGFGAFFSSILDGFRQMLQQMAAEYLASKVANLFMGLLGGLFGGGGGSITGGASPIGGGGFMLPRAMGGPVRAGAAYLVGENGPEMMVPGQSGQIIPNHRMAMAGGGGPSITVNINHPTDVAGLRKSAAQIMSDAWRQAHGNERRNG